MTSISPRTARALRGIMTAGVIALTTAAARADEPTPPWLAQPPAAAQAAPAPEARFPWRASLMIAASAALGGAAVWVRSRKGGLAKLTSSRELRVISSVRVGPKGHLVLAGIGDRAILLGVTDQAVRRIAWLPADQVANSADLAVPIVPADGAAVVNPTTTALGRGERASTAIVPAPAAAPGVSEYGLAPARRSATSGRAVGKGGFAEMLRKIGGRNVDAPPAGDEELSPAATLAELRRDSVQWSKGASSAVHAASAQGSNVDNLQAAAGGRDGDLSPELEQQAAGILKRRSRGKRA